MRSVDIGLDFTWDIFISWCMILLGAAMLGTCTFGKLWGSLGMAIAAVLFFRDMQSAPNPAKPDVSAISFLWFIGVSIKMLVFARQNPAPPKQVAP